MQLALRHFKPVVWCTVVSKMSTLLAGEKRKVFVANLRPSSYAQGVILWLSPVVVCSSCAGHGQVALLQLGVFVVGVVVGAVAQHDS